MNPHPRTLCFALFQMTTGDASKVSTDRTRTDPTSAPTHSPSAFTTTHWSLVRLAYDPSAPQATAALEKLCRTYWRPVQMHVRRQGYNEEDARDLTQDFFAEILRDRTLLAADRDRGRFRSFLLGVLKRFLARAATRARAQKRGGGQSILSWEQDVLASSEAAPAAGDESPDHAFDRHWAIAVLHAAYERLRAEYGDVGREAWLETLQPYLTAEPEAPSYAATATRLGISEGAVKSAIHRLRQRYHAALRREVAQTVRYASEVDDELRYLRSICNETRP